MITTPMRFAPRSFAVISLMLLALSSTRSDAQQAYTPAAGSSERKELLDLVREPIERDVEQKVIFKVERLKVVGDWAVARFVPLKPDGGAIDYRKTKHAGPFENGGFDPSGEAIFLRKKGNWTLVDWAFGGTDSSLAYWVETHKAPAALLK